MKNGESEKTTKEWIVGKGKLETKQGMMSVFRRARGLGEKEHLEESQTRTNIGKIKKGKQDCRWEKMRRTRYTLHQKELVKTRELEGKGKKTKSGNV